MSIFKRAPKTDPAEVTRAENELKQKMSQSPLLSDLINEVASRPWITTRQSSTDDESRDMTVTAHGIEFSWYKWEEGPVKVIGTDRFGLNKYGHDSTKVIFEEVEFDYIKSGYSSLGPYNDGSVTVSLDRVIAIWAEVIRVALSRAFPETDFRAGGNYSSGTTIYIYPASPTKSLF